MSWSSQTRKRKKVILASTSEIYGKKNGNVPFREDSDRILGPTTVVRWSYSTTKAVDELLALAYWKEKRLPVVIVRPFNVIGPRQTGHFGMVVPRLIKQAVLGHPITVYDSGEQRRCWTYIDDAIDGFVGSPSATRRSARSSTWDRTSRAASRTSPPRSRKSPEANRKSSSLPTTRPAATVATRTCRTAHLTWKRSAPWSGTIRRSTSMRPWPGLSRTTSASSPGSPPA